ncbi:MAG: sigma-70 family RNA polymerase sigma factor [Proteobacteria bacterium]|nr:MAG: sigma-70 family RNA polymerase sigma factor [Pseudomonadota bacterium]
MAHNTPKGYEWLWLRYAEKHSPEDEARLVKLYEYLIYQIADEYDTEAHSESYLALLKGIRKYNPYYGVQAQTYLGTCIRHICGKLYAKRVQQAERTLNLDDHEQCNTEGDTESECWQIDRKTESEDEITTRLLLREILDSLSERDRKIMQMLAAGWKVYEIADEIGVCRAWLHTIVKGIRAKLNIEAVEDWEPSPMP